MKDKAIFFDWDGTAVENREESVDCIVKLMGELLKQGVKLIIISGTTYEKIAGGRLHEYFQKEQLDNLYLGLGRGAHNYSFKDGKPVLHTDFLPTLDKKILLHKCVFELHEYLLKKYELESDIVFTRPNYCKLDLMVTHDRNGKLFLQEGEIELLEFILQEHGIKNGLENVIKKAEEIGRANGVKLKVTTDAKYLEIGMTTKSDNVDYFIESLIKKENISFDEISFWGDEFSYLAEGINGSDAYMITDKSQKARFYDVSELRNRLPCNVISLGGGIKTFRKYLLEQGKQI